VTARILPPWLALEQLDTAASTVLRAHDGLAARVKACVAAGIPEPTIHARIRATWLVAVSDGSHAPDVIRAVCALATTPTTTGDP
jgi:hypothetical protein